MTERATALTVVSPYGSGLAGYRERVERWADRLGVTVDAHCYFGRSGMASSFGPSSLPRATRAEIDLRRLRRRGTPALLMHREASPFSTGRLEADLLTAAERSAYDIDDALHADWGDASLLRRVFAKAGKAAAAVERASITVAGNEAVATWAAGLTDDVRIVPTCVDPADYLPRDDHDLHDSPVIAWVGSPSTVRHLLRIEEPLLRLHRETGAVLSVVGGSLDGTALDAMATTMPWSEANQRSTLATADVGVMPLPDGPFERGKSGYKLLQYGAAGLPAVASPVGENRTILDRFGLSGPSSLDDWYETIRTLFDASAADRAAVADRARRAVVEHYSFDAWEPTWRTLLDDLGVAVG